MTALMTPLIAALLFFIVGSPATYKLVQSVLGDVVTIASAAGAPTIAGLAVHSVVFGALTLALMKLRTRRYRKY